MTVVADVPPSQSLATGRRRVASATTNRVRRDGKFFRLGAEKFFVKGVTYGPFEPNSLGEHYPEPDDVRRDFRQILDLGANCVRVYWKPNKWFLDIAEEVGMKVFVDVPWPKNLTFIGNDAVMDQARDAVRAAARDCGNHPATFAISVVNELPADIVRFVGAEPIVDFIDELIGIVKEEAPECLATFANYPTTEFLNPHDVDFLSFNVYLHKEEVFRNYLARLQMIAGEKPLMLGEYGIDTSKEKTEEEQAEILGTHIRCVFDEGLAGTFIFSYTDDWFTGGMHITDWSFGIVRRDRSPKASFETVQRLFRKVPQVSDEQFPKISVLICSYNGASTVETCLASMMRIKYPGEVEIIFVDDGSTDHTQDIVRKFPSVINIQQKNMGLSYARNVAMHAATGEIIVYTDSDCEADEDWLYYIALSLKRSRHVGLGGPNLIPDEGSWVADCVGLSPGGPTHVMIDDRTAEHVPGCNMAYYRWAALQVNGFDPQYRAAGDDVDFIWRLQNNGFSIGFAPAAQVWHYRRNTVKAYLKQQRGYGTAEALLKYKHPDRFNALGASHWRGKIYGGEEIGVKIGRDVIYHGVFGTGLFQTMYRRQTSMTAAMLMSIEWLLLAAFVTFMGLAISQLFWIAVLMFLTPVVLACVAAYQAPKPKHKNFWTKPLIAYLHWRQPITRGWARYSVRLRAKTLAATRSGYTLTRKLPFDPQQPNVLRYWSKSHERLHLMEAITKEVQAAGWRYRTDSGWEGWDIEIFGSRYVKVRLSSATEIHGGGAMLTRVRVEPLMSKFCLVLTVCVSMLSGLLLLHLWPFSRPAALIPIVMATLYLVNRVRVMRPVLGLIDSVADRLKFVAVPREQKSSGNIQDVPDDKEVKKDEPSPSEHSVSAHAAAEHAA
ncbi:MAG TPA: glycosyltransferase [Tepidisphaeraceae bacterium]|jgi:GT2 family glycosyltransferase